MTMLFKTFYLYLMMSVCVAEDMFESLYRARPASRLTACAQARGARACAGLAWTRHWTLVRAACVLPHQFKSIYVKRGVVNCSHDITPTTIEMGDECPRQVDARYTHPSYPAVDLALLRVDRPFASGDLLANGTISDNILNKMDIWMKNILFTESMKTIKPAGHRNYLKMYSTPMRMFLVTVVLPSASFVMFFLFIIFFTGKSKSNKVPYKTLKSNKKETTYV